ncbi:acyl-CoA dehydrogenase family protein [Tsukamurella sp. 8F]|uniref:acyl-CoA dehydrogenase family protein n=1 Tax=unclassified Tsukamurella TaxID=2633480 RepID=UPI0023B8B6DE|nr:MULTISPECIES: acyl-CoA dehydrogenase family protein [unclassified Tsukamurella]MDF0528372.1 acyl-CoA dehydrogenase family protein [Tsukamurella sp. 8J]MDF0586197.1 acyl-CoA dehydrogenase family protein [Tsukamurella sp. 8F]
MTGAADIGAAVEFTESERAFRAEAREWLRAHAPGRLPSMDTSAGAVAHREWEAELAADGWSVIAWPARYGGRDASLTEWVIFEEEYYLAGAPTRIAQNGISLLAPIILGHGTDDQRDTLLPSIADGTTVWAQAWSEPEAGSDLAAIRSRAVRTDGGWLLSGQKIWSSRAPFADSGFGLFRSGRAADSRAEGSVGRHRDLTYFLFPLDAQGIAVRPIRQLDGDAGFAEIFFDDVFVPDSGVLGAVGQGWSVAMSTAGNERGLSLRSPGRFLAAADRLLTLWRERGHVAPEPGANPETWSDAKANHWSDAKANHWSLRDRVVDAWIAAHAYQLYTWGTVDRIESGGSVGSEGSVNKLFWSQLDIALHETGLELLGPEQELLGPHAPDAGRWVEDHLFAVAGPIYAGTNEIQRNIVAERVLGLPRGDNARRT